ncbi:reverse transcriptase-like protein [Elysia marginata]|uniref:Reverse transcriptase-like protein n=1 Tax=Elysia marginata TaxID=1093978 RepID=A0AAV4HN30_9GAST|nr:reverse transcriptase-like protein [Elysia marginata]
MWTATFLHHKEPRLPPTLKTLTAESATTTSTTTTMGTDINNKQNQQAHNVPCIHPHPPPPARANQGCDQNNLINVNLQSTVNECPNKLSHTNKSIQVGYLNAQSCQNKTDEIRELITEHKLDMFFITETWLTQDSNAVIANLTPPAFVIKSFPRLHRLGGGIAVIYRSNLELKISSVGDISIQVLNLWN